MTENCLICNRIKQIQEGTNPYFVTELHWHLFPRHADDPLPTKPVWQIPKEDRRAEQYRLSDKELAKACGELRRTIAEIAL